MEFGVNLNNREPLITSGYGRTVLGACMGNPEHGVRREFEALGLPFGRRAAVFEEGLAVLRSLWTTGKITHHGEDYDLDGVSFYSGTEMGPLMPVQQPPPIWVVSTEKVAEFAFGTSDFAPVGDPSEKGRKGTVHFALGDNQNCYPGGQNRSVLHLDGVCHNVSLQILDTGEYIVKDGGWQL